MTVNELISRLQSMSDDMIVVDGTGFEIEDVIIDEEYYTGDSARPDIKPIAVVKLV